MSVHGEFQRVLGDCLSLLRGRSAPGADARAAALEAAASDAHDDLSRAAGRVLVLLRDEPAPPLDSGARRRELARQENHLAQLCRVIVGHRS